MLRLTSIVTVLLTVLLSTAQAQWRRDWIPLGQQSVGPQADRDVITVTQSDDFYRERGMRALIFLVDRNDVYIAGIRLTYSNGFSEDFRVDQVIRDGDQYELDLRGERSYIRQIEMLYRARPDNRGLAFVSVYGIPFRGFSGPSAGGAGFPGGPGGPGFPGGSGGGRNEWVELGCQEVNIFSRDRDTIRVGRRDGRFKAIRLLVRDADVEVRDLKVIYSNGRPDDISVQNLIRAGDRTRALDLQGRERSIDRIELLYRTVVNPGGIIEGRRLRNATVCVEGLQ